MPQRVDARVHARDDGDAGVGDAVEAAERERLGERAVGGEEVVERTGHGVATVPAPWRRRRGRRRSSTVPAHGAGDHGTPGRRRRGVERVGAGVRRRRSPPKAWPSPSAAATGPASTTPRPPSATAASGWSATCRARPAGRPSSPRPPRRSAAIDILVTNAGGPPPGDFASTDVDAYPAAIDRHRRRWTAKFPRRWTAGPVPSASSAARRSGLHPPRPTRRRPSHTAVADRCRRLRGPGRADYRWRERPTPSAASAFAVPSPNPLVAATAARRPVIPSSMRRNRR